MAAKTILITNEKGGVGKTTTTTALSVGTAAAINGRVLMIDTDPQGNVAKNLGIDVGGRCLSYLIEEASSFSDQIVQCAPNGQPRSNLYLLPSSKRLGKVLEKMSEDIGAMEELAKRMTPGARKQMNLEQVPTVADTFNRILGPLKGVFEYIFIDSQPSIGILQDALHRFADFAVVPTQVDYMSVEQTGEHTRTILEAHKKTQEDGWKRVKLLAVVPTFVDPQLSLTKEMWQDLVETYGRLLARPIPRRTDIGKCPALGGLTILDYKPDSDGAKAYRHLLDRVMAAS